MSNKKKDRPISSIKIELDELPERRIPTSFKNAKEQVKYIKTVESLVRRSKEYKDYIKFLRDNMDMRRCTVLRGLDASTQSGKKYSIEIHHEPFTLFDIVQTIINKRLSNGQTLDMFTVADECMYLHYEGKVGLIPLSKTMHELVHNDKIFIPLQYIYQEYSEFYSEYEGFFDETLLQRIQTKINLSMKTSDILSDVLDTEFIYVEVDGVNFPEIPKEWENVLKLQGDEE